MISVFVVSCPCALGVAAPLADDIAASRAEGHGVFVRTLGLWKKLTRLRQVVFDKTGTLTLENPVLVNPESLAALDDTSRQALRHLTSGNLHPVSRSLFDALGGTPDRLLDVEVIEEAGHGLRFEHQGSTWAISRPKDQSADAIFTRDGAEVAAFRFHDALRGESGDEVRALARRGLRVSILSGDREAKVSDIAAQLGLARDQWHYSLTPDEKAAWISSHDPQGTLYIGDGANDSLAFDAASCAGSPVTGRSFLEHKADFYFLGHSMRFMSSLLDIAATHRLAVSSVFAFSVTYNIVTAIMGLMGHLSPLLAAILMPLSSVCTLSLVALIFRGSARTVQNSASRGAPRAIQCASIEPA